MGHAVDLADLNVHLERQATPLHVLVADDDEGIRNLLNHYLTEEGFNVETARSGREALARLREAPPDIVLLDVAMPGTDGLDVLATVRERQLDTAVIICTAYGSEQLVAEALRRGADDYLRKPFEAGDMQAVFDRTTARLLLRRQNVFLRARIEEHQRHLEAELARAAETVAELLPLEAPPLAGFELAGTCLAAREVGGDFYDWQQLPSGELTVTVGDVMGKGLSASLLMATTRGVIRALALHHHPGDVVQRAAAALDHDLSRSGAFVTLFHAHADLSTGLIRYVDAGHGYVLLLRADGTVTELKPWGLPLGVDSEEQYHEGSAQLAPGDALHVYSDGLTEARADLFGHRDAVAAFAARGATAAAMVDDLVREVAHVKPLPDDLTIVVLRRRPLS
jgi:sigma-B regulation protein RsbU (phosphoserine phosphatase)